jgi:hypothetical protein
MFAKISDKILAIVRAMEDEPKKEYILLDIVSEPARRVCVRGGAGAVSSSSRYRGDAGENVRSGEAS